MVGYDSKIYCVAYTALLCLFSFATVLTAGIDQEKMTLFNLKLPIYQNDSAVPTVILYAEEAKPIGVNFELKGVKLNWLGASVSEIRGVVTTPAAVYNRSTNLVSGNQWIRYRSKEMDLDGIGFDIDQVKQTIHIRSKVKVTIKGKFESNREKRLNAKRSPKKLDKSSKLNLLASALKAIVKPEATPKATTKKVLQKESASPANITL
ncbi:MAG: hypothetical protein KAG97_09485, partial [Victivallales bacterium]|nr:hypothetical protein [Victivallales bacterium]